MGANGPPTYISDTEEETGCESGAVCAPTTSGNKNKRNKENVLITISLIIAQWLMMDVLSGG